VSETPRQLPSSIRRRRGRRQSVRRHAGSGRGLARAALVALILLVVAWWASRDTVELRTLVPADHTYHIALLDIVTHRDAIIESPVWRALPEAAHAGRVLELLGRDTKMPAWVLNNLMGELSYVTGSDLDQYADVVYLARMTRVGRLLEYLHVFWPGIVDDNAGGLHLRHVEDSGLYYAVRGRVLLASLSRDALIRCLTLREDEILPEGAFHTVLDRSGPEQVRGLISFPPDTPVGGLLRSLTFALHIDRTSAHMEYRGILYESWRERFGRLLGNAAPRPLIAPPPGIAGISVDVGKSLDEVCYGIGEAFDIDALREESMTLAANPDDADPDEPDLRSFLAMLSMLGPGVRLSLQGVDLDEFIPMPELAGSLDAQGALVRALLETLRAPDDAAPWEPYARFDPETRLASIPMIGGPSLEPTFAVYDDRLYVSSSARIAHEWLGNPPSAQALPQHGNLYLRIEPLSCLEAWAGVGRELVAQDLLKGYSPETFDASIQQWRARLAPIEHIALLLAIDRGALAGRISVEGVGTVQTTDAADTTAAPEP